jgi:hypothetical protein
MPVTFVTLVAAIAALIMSTIALVTDSPDPGTRRRLAAAVTVAHCLRGTPDDYEAGCWGGYDR